MPDLAKSLTTALAHHLSGQWNQAESIYHQVLAQDLANVDAWHLLGMLAHQRSQLDLAESHIRRALELKPDFADAHNNLGNVLKDRGQIEAAVSCYEQAAKLNPNLPEAQFNLGNHYQKLGQPAEAIAHYQRAIAANPNHIEAHSNLGAVLQAEGRLDEAIHCYRQALHLAPDNRDARFNLATALQAQKNYNDAIAEYRQTLAQHPNFVEAWFNLGNAYREIGAFDDAIPCYNRALDLQPDYAKAHTNLGVIGYWQERIGDAMECFDRALSLEPNNAETHLMRSFGLLLTGDCRRGFEENEWRLQKRPAIGRSFAEPRWRGEPLAGRAILLHTEQGLGDTLQFIRYASLVKARCGHVVVQCQRRLKPLLSRCPGIDEVVEENQPLPVFAAQSPLLSLPYIFATTLDSVPADIPYLFADPVLIARWRDRLSAYRSLRVGINWRGSGHGLFRLRDVPLQEFARLATLPGITLLSLQRGPARGELPNLQGKTPLLDPGDDVDVATGAFMDTAAIMMNLDLVITSDTAIAHLAGALGVPVWVALPFAPEWRWLLNRTDSPWYPTMRLFRQPRHGDWTTVFEQIAAELAAAAHPS